MKTLIQVKKELCLLETLPDCLQAVEFLHVEWNKNRDDCDLCLLLIQQMVLYLEIFDGDRHRHETMDFSVERRKLYVQVLEEVLEESKSIRNKTLYYYWQMCLYYYAYPTYYWVLTPSVFRNPILYAQELEKEGMLAYPDSILVKNSQFDLTKHGSWIEADWGSRCKLKDEVFSFHLQNNLVDEGVKDYFEWVFEN